MAIGFRQNVNLTEQIADHVGFEIITGAREPGSRIQELKIAKALGVSRGSVREALLILAGRHLVDIVPRRGAVVNGLTPARIPAFSELFTEVLAMAVRRVLARPGQLPDEDLAAAVAAMDRAVRVDDREEVISQLVAARGDFLNALLELVDDRFLRSVVVGLVPISQRLTFIAAGAADFEPRDLPRFYHAVLDALVARDETRLCERVSAYARREKRMALGCGR
jgi:DNA-binding GntR family transcriptional regulator